MVNIETVFPIKDLEQHIVGRLVSKRKHPDLPLYIYNYTPQASFDNVWDKITTTCRGLILDEDYNIVARPFRKFFNLNTSNRPETHVENLPPGIPIVTEKMDGSLGIYWNYKGYHGIATRGSFTSDQAKWASEYYDLHYGYTFNWCNSTPLFEIIFPSNRIVVDYKGKCGLVLLGIIHNDDGLEYGYQEMINTGFPDIVKVYWGKSISDCVSESEMDLPVNTEGYVIRLDTELYPLRVKVKFAEYLRLHRLTFSLNSGIIWESLSQGKDPLDGLSDLPKDVIEWIDCVSKDMKFKFNFIKSRAKVAFYGSPDGNRKDKALWFQKTPDVQAVCFAMLDGKDVDRVIWKMVEPERVEIFRRDACNEAE
jgi:RNA ligase